MEQDKKNEVINELIGNEKPLEQQIPKVQYVPNQNVNQIINPISSNMGQQIYSTFQQNMIPSQIQPPLASSQIIGTSTGQPIKGESRIEYVPYEKTIIEYETVTRTEKIPRERKIIEYEEVSRVEYVPKEKKITDYYAVEYVTEYIPQVYQEKIVEYIPQERVQERVEYQALEKQTIHGAVQEAQQQVQVVQAPMSYVQQQPMSYVQQQPVSYVQQQPMSYVQQQPISYVQQQPISYVQQQPMSYVQQPIVSSQILSQPIQTVERVQEKYVEPQYIQAQQPLTYSYVQPTTQVVRQEPTIIKSSIAHPQIQYKQQPIIKTTKPIQIKTQTKQQPQQQGNLLGFLFED